MELLDGSSSYSDDRDKEKNDFIHYITCDQVIELTLHPHYGVVGSFSKV